MTDATKLRAIEICCCAGGMALGFRRAGIEFAFAFDKDADACNSYEHNLGHRPVRMDVHDLLRLVEGGWRPGEGEVDLVVADPPCTPYSTAGRRRGIHDERDCLRAVVEIVRILKPQAFLLGNVPGLQNENHDADRRSTIGSLCYDGYCIDEAVLDAASFGVAQRRIRPFWYVHSGGPCLTWPAATHGPPSSQGQLPGAELLPWVTCRDVLSDLPQRDIGKARRVHVGQGNWHHPADVDQPSPVLTTTTPGMLLTWPWDRPSTTVTTEARIPAPGHKSTSRRTFDECIVLSERARARLQGFPDEWKFIGKTKRSRNSQLGQAMCPALAEAVARSIVEWFDGQRVRENHDQAEDLLRAPLEDGEEARP